MGIRSDSLLQLTRQNTADKTAKALLIIFIFFCFWNGWLFHFHFQ